MNTFYTRFTGNFFDVILQLKTRNLRGELRLAIYSNKHRANKLDMKKKRKHLFAKKNDNFH